MGQSQVKEYNEDYTTPKQYRKKIDRYKKNIETSKNNIEYTIERVQTTMDELHVTSIADLCNIMEFVNDKTYSVNDNLLKSRPYRLALRYRPLYEEVITIEEDRREVCKMLTTYFNDKYKIIDFIIRILSELCESNILLADSNMDDVLSRSNTAIKKDAYKRLENAYELQAIYYNNLDLQIRNLPLAIPQKELTAMIEAINILTAQYRKNCCQLTWRLIDFTWQPDIDLGYVNLLLQDIYRLKDKPHKDTKYQGNKPLQNGVRICNPLNKVIGDDFYIGRNRYNYIKRLYSSSISEDDILSDEEYLSGLGGYGHTKNEEDEENPPYFIDEANYSVQGGVIPFESYTAYPKNSEKEEDSIDDTFDPSDDEKPLKLNKKKVSGGSNTGVNNSGVGNTDGYTFLNEAPKTTLQMNEVEDQSEDQSEEQFPGMNDTYYGATDGMEEELQQKQQQQQQ